MSKKIILKESQINNFNNGIDDFLRNKSENPIFKKIRTNKNDLDSGNLDSIIDVDGWDERDDPETREEEFYNELTRLSAEGAETFDNIRKLCVEHPYALHNAELLKDKLAKIDLIIKSIDEMYV